MPLLKGILERAGKEGRLVPELPSFRDMARGLRRWLKKAGITRRELHERTPTTLPITFHDGADAERRRSRSDTRRCPVRKCEEAPICGRVELCGGADAERRRSRSDTRRCPVRKSEEGDPLGSPSSILRGGRDSNPRPPA